MHATCKRHAPPGCLLPAACGGAQLEQLKATTEAKEVSFKIAYGLPLPEMVKWGLYISEPHRRARAAGLPQTAPRRLRAPHRRRCGRSLAGAAESHCTAGRCAQHVTNRTGASCP